MHIRYFTHLRACARVCAYTHKVRNTPTQTHRKLLCTHRCFYANAHNTFTHRTFHAEAFLHTHTYVFPNQIFQAQNYTQNFLHTSGCKHTESFTHRNFYTQALGHRLWHGVPLHIVACTHKYRRNFEHRTPVYTETSTRR